MYCTIKLKLNRFVATPVKSASEAFESLGFSAPRFPSSSTIDDIDTLATKPASKLQRLALGEEIADKAYKFATDPEHTQPLERIDPSNL